MEIADIRIVKIHRQRDSKKQKENWTLSFLCCLSTRDGFRCIFHYWQNKTKKQFLPTSFLHETEPRKRFFYTAAMNSRARDRRQMSKNWKPTTFNCFSSRFRWAAFFSTSYNNLASTFLCSREWMACCLFDMRKEIWNKISKLFITWPADPKSWKVKKSFIEYDEKMKKLKVSQICRLSTTIWRIIGGRALPPRL